MHSTRKVHGFKSGERLRSMKFLLLSFLIVVMGGFVGAAAAFVEVPIHSITLAPDPGTALSNPIGTSITLNATVLCPKGSPVPMANVTFLVTDGPDAGQTITTQTNAWGVAKFSYTGSGAGTDTIAGSVETWTGGTISASDITQVWTTSDPQSTGSDPVFLFPITSTQQIGTPEVMTASVLSDGQPVPGDTVTFTVTDGPNKGLSGMAVTNGTGMATMSYTSQNEGTDTIVATVAGQSSNLATVSWLISDPSPIAHSPTPHSITLSPTSSTDPVGDTHTVTATVLCPLGHPVPGWTVTFMVTSGPNAGKTGTAVTDSSGMASFSYTDSAAGTDSIVASVITQTGSTLSSDPVTKTWLASEPTVNPTPTSTPTTVSTTPVITYTPTPMPTTPVITCTATPMPTTTAVPIPAPEFPSIVLPVGMIIGFVGLVFGMKRKEG